MSLTITRTQEYVDVIEHEHKFVTGPGSWFGFPCDAEGNVDVEKLPDAARKNYHICLTGKYGEGEVVEISSSYIEPAAGKCECGQVLILRGDQTCDCGRMYNRSGQELARIGFDDRPGEEY
jgi:hypothetical protein